VTIERIPGPPAVYLVDVLYLRPHVLLLAEALAGSPGRGREEDFVWSAHTVGGKEQSGHCAAGLE